MVEVKFSVYETGACAICRSFPDCRILKRVLESIR